MPKKINKNIRFLSLAETSDSWKYVWVFSLGLNGILPNTEFIVFTPCRVIPSYNARVFQVKILGAFCREGGDCLGGILTSKPLSGFVHFFVNRIEDLFQTTICIFQTQGNK